MTPIRSLPKLPERKVDAHKGSFGRLLIVGGSAGMVGAPALAANAALRGGAGLVKIACPDCCQQTTAGLAPCATSVPLPSTQEGVVAARAVAVLRELVVDHEVMAIGPGMGQGAGAKKVVSALMAVEEKPKVVDADGLNNLAALGQWWTGAKGPIVLTPHPGEMRRLLDAAGLDVPVNRRERCAVALAEKTGAVVVLKGAGTIVTDGRRGRTNESGNPGMATAGAGDVLTGLVAALIGQGLSALDAAALGVHIHGLAGDIAACELGQVSVTAADLVDYLPEAFLSL